MVLELLSMLGVLLVKIETYLPMKFFLSTKKYFFNSNKRRYEKVQVKNVFYLELSGKPNVKILGIKVYMCKWHNLETILTFNDVINIQNYIENWFGSIERAYYMGTNAYLMEIQLKQLIFLIIRCS